MVMSADAGNGMSMDTEVLEESGFATRRRMMIAYLRANGAGLATEAAVNFVAPVSDLRLGQAALGRGERADRLFGPANPLEPGRVRPSPQGRCALDPGAVRNRPFAPCLRRRRRRADAFSFAKSW